MTEQQVLKSDVGGATGETGFALTAKIQMGFPELENSHHRGSEPGELQDGVLSRVKNLNKNQKTGNLLKQL